jgi:hypothetical protein
MIKYPTVRILGVVTGHDTSSPIYPEATGDQKRTAERILDKK